jgi:hypothetical protein
MEISPKGGEYLVRLARDSIKYYLDNLVPLRPPKDVPRGLTEKRGVFCTILTYPKGSLRGCIGSIFPEKPLLNALIEASCSATQDPRFFPLHNLELEQVTLEVTVLGQMEKLSVFEPRDYLSLIEVGRDGLFIRRRNNCAVFLPQVPVEQKWSKKEYICELCRKAGLDCDTWVVKPVELYRFGAQVFSESDPGGNIYERDIKNGLRVK